MAQLIVLCRSGYEAVTSEELTFELAQINVAGYGQIHKGQGWLEFNLIQSQGESFKRTQIEACLRALIFPRQIWWKLADVSLANKQDRIADVLLALESSVEANPTPTQFDDVLVEYPDTEDGKEVAKFAKKITVPLRQALRNKRFLVPKHLVGKTQFQRLHLMLTNFDKGFIGESIPNVSREEVGGITRLKFPADSPSRSTLKLEDAILNMLSQQERQRIFYSGATAVDLGACPGGWTYQLVKRGMHVEAIDNGDISESLMATGLVDHFAKDGFTYKPAYGHVTLLVCDMIEKPDRVARLMASWLTTGLADHAIFNLKLPMKQRFDTVKQCLTYIEEELKNFKAEYRLSARHLYHDRDEITVCIISR